MIPAILSPLEHDNVSDGLVRILSAIQHGQELDAVVVECLCIAGVANAAWQVVVRVPASLAPPPVDDAQFAAAWHGRIVVHAAGHDERLVLLRCGRLPTLVFG